MKTLNDHLFSKGPKRVLSLDGGGIRGVITLGILEKIEKIVGSPLSNYFDLIGGTSTGSIIAAGLALGWPVAKLKELYKVLGPHVFKKKWNKIGIIRAKFSAKPLRKALNDYYGETRLGSDEFKTGLAIIAKRLDTNSPWVLFNNPKGKYFNTREGSTAIPSRQYRVQDLIRASTAAPHFFEPLRLRIAADTEGAFVDGGTSPHNNPALQLFLLATLCEYRLGWNTGDDQLLIVSVGTGTWKVKLDTNKLIKQTAAQNAALSLLSLMDDCSELVELLMQGLSNSPTAKKIDKEVGDLSGDMLGGNAMLSYLRYNALLEDKWLKRQLPEEKFDQKKIDKLRKMDLPDYIRVLQKIGKAAAHDVKPEHFPAAFALPG